MSTNTSDHLSSALSYLNRGWAPIPLCWPTPEGACGCGRNHMGKDTGKAPLLGEGYQQLRPTEEDVRRWWAAWPVANIGLLLEPSGLLVVDCDSQEAWQEAARHTRGLIFPMSSTGRGVHFYFKANGILGRSTKQGDHHAIDVLSKGYVVAPPSVHPTGRSYGWMVSPDRCELQNAPEWAYKSLEKEFRPRILVRGAPAGRKDPDEEPPVRLSDRGLELWQGDLVVDKEDGRMKPIAQVVEPDRSETLYVLGAELARAGASLATIVDSLASRDESLGFEKYSDRRDGGESEYERIADKVLTETLAATTPHSPRTPVVAVQTSGWFVPADVLALSPGESGVDWLPVLGQEGLVGRGVSTLLSGRPKGGKTTLTAHSVRQWLEAGLIVAWLTEEPREVWRSRITALGIDKANLLLGFSDGANPRNWRARLEELHPDVIIIDTAREFLKIKDENDAALVQRALSPMIQAARGLNAALVILHHRRKSEGTEGTDHAGSHAFVGACDITTSLKEMPLATQCRELETRSRFQDSPQRLLVELSPSGNYLAIDGKEQVTWEDTVRRVREALFDEWLPTSVVRDQLGEPTPSREYVRRALHQLVCTSVVERKEGKGNQGDEWRLLQQQDRLQG